MRGLLEDGVGAEREGHRHDHKPRRKGKGEWLGVGASQESLAIFFVPVSVVCQVSHETKQKFILSTCSWKVEEEHLFTVICPLPCYLVSNSMKVFLTISTILQPR